MSSTDVSALIPRFKRAAIDAYMRTSPSGWEINGDSYEIDSSSAHYTVTRPGPDGEGGGDWSSDNFIADIFVGGGKDEEFGAAFDSIRSRIDEAIAPWLHLPDPGTIEGEVTSALAVTRKLSGAAAASEGTQVGAGLIAGNIALIMENSDAMSGAAIAAFKSRFVSQLGPVIGGLHGLSVVLGAALAAEQKLWESARENVRQIVQAGVDASEELAASGATGGYEVALKVAGWAAQGAKLFVPGAGAVFEVVGLGIQVVQGSSEQDPEKETITGADAAAVLSTFEAALRALNEGIAHEETLLDENLSNNLTAVQSQQSSYDLSAPLVQDDPASSSDVIIIEPSLVTEISSTYLPTISAELSGSATALLSASMSCVARDGALGIGASGPSGAWGTLRTLLYDLLRNLAWDVTTGAQNLDLVLQDMQSNEQRVVDEMAQFLARFDAGNPVDPWR